MSKPLVALVQPSAGGHRVPFREAARAYWRASKGLDRLELEQSTSMLPRCFNMLWADALNLRAQHPITHFAMLHDDVGAELGWLDTLYAEMERTGADILSVVVPIKNHFGVTSTAIDNPADPWIVRRLTMKEAFDLPETFGIEDIPYAEPGSCLLANTGCWICRFDSDWVERFADVAWHGDGQSGFRFRSKIIKGPEGKYLAADIPEDWDFSRMAAKLGRRVLCTRKVKVQHELPAYHNAHPWGNWPTDLHWLEYQQALRAGDGPPGWRFPADVDGWLSEREGRALADLARGKDVLEIGSYCGRSTICLAQTAARVCAVDPFDGRSTPTPRKTLPAFLENLARYSVLAKVKVCEGASVEMVPHIDACDLAFIDGAHDQVSVLADAAVALGKLRPGGLLAFHDYQRPGDEGVTAAVNMLLQGGAELVGIHDTLAVLRPAA